MGASLALLDGLCVIELAEGVSGPYCAKLLRDLGADVIKVEPPCGEVARTFEPFLADRAAPDRSGPFAYLNQGKLGVTLDVRAPEGKRLLTGLLRDADILIENLGATALDELGIDLDAMQATLPALVVTSIGPFGAVGPRRHWQGTELTLWHASGYAVLTPAGGSEESAPLHPQCAQAAYMAGANAAGATMAALFDRERTGRGQRVDVSEQETLIAALSPQLADYFYEARTAWTRGAARLNIMQFIPCKDGYVSMLITQPDQWERLVAWLGDPEWAHTDDFGGIQGMTQNWDLIRLMFSQTFAGRTKDVLFAEGQARRIPIAPVNTIAETVALEHLAQRGYFERVPVADGEALMPGPPYRFDGRQRSAAPPAPRLSEHNEAVYRGRLGLNAEQLLKLYEAGII